jgi:aarF domain-containing kinase
MLPLAANPGAAREFLPLLPAVATQIVPEVASRLFSRITARALREVFVAEPAKLPTAY